MNAPVLATRSAGSGTVVARFRAMLGSDVRRDELLTLRRGLMGNLFHPPSQDEKRSKAVMVAS
jgi:hypothetical protein